MKHQGKKENEHGKVMSTVLIVIIAITIGFFLGSLSIKEDTRPNTSSSSEPKAEVELVDAKLISEELSEIEELVTAQDDFKEEITVQDGRFPLITQKGFTMSYQAIAKAGFDLSDFNENNIQVTNSNVKITLPKAKILSLYINPDTIEFRDKKKALFNWNKQEDVAQALSLATEDAYDRINADELTGKAEKNAQNKLEKILQPLLDGKTVEVNFAE